MSYTGVGSGSRGCRRVRRRTTIRIMIIKINMPIKQPTRIPIRSARLMSTEDDDDEDESLVAVGAAVVVGTGWKSYRCCVYELGSATKTRELKVTWNTSCSMRSCTKLATVKSAITSSTIMLPRATVVTLSALNDIGRSWRNVDLTAILKASRSAELENDWS